MRSFIVLIVNKNY